MLETMTETSDSPDALAAWSVTTAFAAARNGQLEACLHRYLAVEPWANPGMWFGCGCVGKRSETCFIPGIGM
jgi:hypothetical protein